MLFLGDVPDFIPRFLTIKADKRSRKGKKGRVMLSGTASI